MESSPEQFRQLKEGMRRTWMAGDFGEIARYSMRIAEDFINRLPIRPGSQVLDVACGTGNLAIPAAAKGAQVTGIDIAANLLEQARQRAAEEKLEIHFDEGDAEDLPYPEAVFDFTVSMFGAMFAPRPKIAAQELLRVTRPGGIIAMANWTPGGFAGRMFRITAQHAPPPPGVPASVLWGDENTVRERFASGVSRLELTRRPIEMRFPFAPGETVRFFRNYFGPMQMAYARLDESGQAALTADMERLWTDENLAQDGTTSIPNEYLEVVATRA